MHCQSVSCFGMGTTRKMADWCVDARPLSCARLDLWEVRWRCCVCTRTHVASFGGGVGDGSPRAFSFRGRFEMPRHGKWHSCIVSYDKMHVETRASDGYTKRSKAIMIMGWHRDVASSSPRPTAFTT